MAVAETRPVAVRAALEEALPGSSLPVTFSGPLPPPSWGRASTPCRACLQVPGRGQEARPETTGSSVPWGAETQAVGCSWAPGLPPRAGGGSGAPHSSPGSLDSSYHCPASRGRASGEEEEQGTRQQLWGSWPPTSTQVPVLLWGPPNWPGPFGTGPVC